MLRRTALKPGKPLKRTPLARGTSKLRTKKPMRRKRAGERRSSRVHDKAHLAFVRSLPCCAPPFGCREQSEAHHNTFGRGLGQKCSDSESMPLCHAHHAALHALAGPFKGWSQSKLREWQAQQVLTVMEKKHAQDVA